MKPAYRCLIIDHDDTAVSSTAEIHYPAHQEMMRKLRPGLPGPSMETWFLKNFDPGVIQYLQGDLGLSDAELMEELEIWRGFTTTRVPHFFPGVLDLLRAFRHHDNTEIRSTDVARVNLRRYGLEREGNFRNQDDVRATGDSGVQRNPTSLAAHHLHEHDAMVALGRAVEPVDQIGRDLHGGLEPDAVVGAADVVVDRLGDADGADAVVVEVASRPEAAVSADHDQPVEPALGHRPPDHVDPAGGGVGLVAAGAEDRAALVNDPGHPVGAQLERVDRMRVGQADLQPGVPSRQRRHRRRHERSVRRGEAGKAHAAGVQSHVGGELRPGGIDAADDLGGAVGQQLPGRGEPDPSADPLQQLRAGLGPSAKYRVAKNTRVKRAAEDAGIQGLENLFVGATAIAFVEGEAVDAAKALRDFAKDNNALVIKGGYMDGRPLSLDEVNQLADLDSREVLLAKLAGAMKGKMSQAAALSLRARGYDARFLGVVTRKGLEREMGAAGRDPRATALREIVEVARTELSSRNETRTARTSPIGSMPGCE